jgi:hypothetical protein
MPTVQDCYYDDSVCAEDEWCFVNTQEMWGPWAMGNSGETPGANGRAGLQCSEAESTGMTWWYDNVCSRNSSWGPWDSMRGRCIKYKQAGESCVEDFQGELFGPMYPVRRNDGGLLSPSLAVCDKSKGLICTGDNGPTPHTCVKRRPANICFLGPWWDSSWCKVGGGAGGEEYTTGLPQAVLEEAAASFILQMPQEHLVATDADYWYSAEGNRTREIAQNIVRELWPAVYRPTTEFPIPYPDPRLTGPPYTAAWNETAVQAQSIMFQTPKVWSTVHMLIANLEPTLTASQVQASQAMAMFLAQNFNCPDCRGFWRADVLNFIGMPPATTEQAAHEHWWWLAHNMVSGHTASTRGGYPWIYPELTDADFAARFGPLNPQLRCQNPYWLAREDAHLQWKIVTP